MSKQDKIAARRRAQDPYPNLADVLNRKVLDRHVAAGIVGVSTHDQLPLYVYNYTSRCEQRRSWDQVTVTCRGLVRDNQGRVLARPFQKFFGYDQKSTSAVRAVRFTDDWYAQEKLDGTMLTASNLDGTLVLASRGSFDAWQLAAARRIWPERMLPAPGTTWVCEYVGPDNLIAVRYDAEEVALLGVIDNWTGADDFVAYGQLCATGAFRVPETYTAAGVDSLLRCQPEDGTMEGFVAVWPRRGKPSGRLKVKHAAWGERRREILAGG